jgi:uncharacterized protein (TIGR02246 family)
MESPPPIFQGSDTQALQPDRDKLRISLHTITRSLAMRFPELLPIVLFATTCLAAAHIGPTTSELSVRDALTKQNANLEQGLAAKDAARMTIHYADDAVLMPPGAPSAVGHDAIRGYWQGLIDQGVRDVSVRIDNVDVNGDTAIERGLATVHATAPDGTTVTLQSRYMVVWKHAKSGEWKIQYDIWNDQKS